MDVQSLHISKVFSSGGEVHYILPHFQREYAWEKPNWQTLLTDATSIYDIYTDDQEPEHFMGALVVINEGMRNGTMTAFTLVDGQQRLTTVSIALCALSAHIKDKSPQLHRKIRRLLVNEDEDSRTLQYFKLLPTAKNHDRQAYMDIIQERLTDRYATSRIPHAYSYFHQEFANRLKSYPDAERWFKVFVNAMHVVFIELKKHEKPHEIFESLNAKGKPLTQPDLVRNYIAMKLPGHDQEKIFNEVWLDIETRLDENKVGATRLGELTGFFRHYLAFQSGTLPNQDHVYARLRDRMEHEFTRSDDFINEIRTLRRFAEFYSLLLNPEKEHDPQIRARLCSLEIADYYTANPFLLALYNWYESHIIDRQTFLQGLELIENYFMRRFLAGEQTSYTNKMFPLLAREIDPRDLVPTLSKALLNRNYPTDAMIREELPRRNLYNARSKQRLVRLLMAVNKDLSEGSGGYTTLNDEPTIEHIMPQSLTPEWQQDLGRDYREIHQQYLHTLGNLTLVTQEWNSQLSNSPFRQKRQKLANHALLLNKQYFDEPSNRPFNRPMRWDKTAIESRATWLTERLLKKWPPIVIAGQIAARPPTKRTKPVTLTLLDTIYPVKTWKEVAYTMANEIAGQIGEVDFNRAASEMGAFLRAEGSEGARQIENAPRWWLTANLSSESVISFCEQMVLYAGFHDSDWGYALSADS